MAHTPKARQTERPSIEERGTSHHPLDQDVRERPHHRLECNALHGEEHGGFGEAPSP